MDLHEFIETLEEACGQAVAEEAQQIAAEIRRTTPANRTETRQAVRVRRNGTTAQILLQFPRRYGGTNTPTHKRFRTQWSRIRPESKRRFIARLVDKLQQ
jgi:hypothetical protein